MKQKKENRVALLLHWAGGQKIWLFLAILLSMCSGLCIIVPYIGIYRLMDATLVSAEPFWKDFSPAACLCCFTLLCSFCGRVNLT